MEFEIGSFLDGLFFSSFLALNTVQFCLEIGSRGHTSVGVMGAATSTLFSKMLFCSHRNPLKYLESYNFVCKLMEIDLLHPKFSISFAAPGKY